MAKSVQNLHELRQVEILRRWSDIGERILGRAAIVEYGLLASLTGRLGESEPIPPASLVELIRTRIEQYEDEPIPTPS